MAFPFCTRYHLRDDEFFATWMPGLEELRPMFEEIRNGKFLYFDVVHFFAFFAGKKKFA
jgi:hypothetical protein